VAEVKGFLAPGEIIRAGMELPVEGGLWRESPEEILNLVRVELSEGIGGIFKLDWGEWVSAGGGKGEKGAQESDTSQSLECLNFP
jgi:hypothetical protein